MHRQKLHHFHNSLGLLRPNPLPKVSLRHSLIHHRIDGLVTDFRSLGLLRPNPLPKVLLRHSLIHHRINGLVTDFRINGLALIRD